MVCLGLKIPCPLSFYLPRPEETFGSVGFESIFKHLEIISNERPITVCNDNIDMSKSSSLKRNKIFTWSWHKVSKRAAMHMTGGQFQAKLRECTSRWGCRTIFLNCWTKMLTVERLAMCSTGGGCTLQYKEKRTLVLKPRGDLTRNPKQRNQWSLK